MSLLASIASRSDWLQNLASRLVAGIDPSVAHNLEKYGALHKVHYMASVEQVPGDYLEFGVFSGSSLRHAMRCQQRFDSLSPHPVRFFGFDSFQGFGEVSAEDSHPAFRDQNFVADSSQVRKSLERMGTGQEWTLVEGFFEQTLSEGPQEQGITAARVVFIDCDLYESASQALSYCAPILQPGSFIVLDDFFGYRGRRDRGVCRAFDEVVEAHDLDVRQVSSYGMGGTVWVCAGSHK
jgi:O-methyltransferase